MIKLQWVDREYFETADEYWDCAIPDDEIDQTVRNIMEYHENQVNIDNRRINQNLISNKEDVVFFFTNRLVLFAFRYYICLKKLDPNDVEVIIDNQIYHIAYNGKMKFKDEKEYSDYNKVYDDHDLYDKYLSELVFQVESNPIETLKEE